MTYLVVGLVALKARPIVIASLQKSLFWAGFAQLALTLVFLCGIIVGGYFLATRYKK